MTAASLPFAREADRALAKGNLGQARLMLQIVLSKEPTNRRVLERLRALGPSMRPPMM